MWNFSPPKPNLAWKYQSRMNFYLKFLFELEPTQNTENFYLHVCILQPLTQYLVVLDLELTKRPMELSPHIFTSLFHKE